MVGDIRHCGLGILRCPEICRTGKPCHCDNTSPHDVVSEVVGTLYVPLSTLTTIVTREIPGR
jgi:hypothetical protein